MPEPKWLAEIAEEVKRLEGIFRVRETRSGLLLAHVRELREALQVIVDDIQFLPDARESAGILLARQDPPEVKDA